MTGISKSKKKEKKRKRNGRGTTSSRFLGKYIEAKISDLVFRLKKKRNEMLNYFLGYVCDFAKRMQIPENLGVPQFISTHLYRIDI